jgi:hypothetical protein
VEAADRLGHSTFLVELLRGKGLALMNSRNGMRAESPIKAGSKSSLEADFCSPAS